MQHIPQIVNMIGLVCDICGALLIWKYGLPDEISKSGAGYLMLEQTDEAEIKLAQSY